MHVFAYTKSVCLDVRTSAVRHSRARVYCVETDQHIVKILPTPAVSYILINDATIARKFGQVTLNGAVEYRYKQIRDLRVMYRYITRQTHTVTMDDY